MVGLIDFYRGSQMIGDSIDGSIKSYRNYDGLQAYREAMALQQANRAPSPMAMQQQSPPLNAPAQPQGPQYPVVDEPIPPVRPADLPGPSYPGPSLMGGEGAIPRLARPMTPGDGLASEFAGKWAQQGRSANSESTVGFGSWSEGRTLALIRAGMAINTRFEVVAGKKGGPVPAPAQAKRDEAHFYCMTRLNGDAFTALPTGEVFMAGTLCEVDNDASAVERWAPGKKDGVIDRLPGAAADARLDVNGLVARAGNDAYVIGHVTKDKREVPYLAHFDGTRWTEETPPMTGSSVTSVTSIP